MVEKNCKNCCYRNDEVTNYVNFLKNYAKMAKTPFFSKINLVLHQDLSGSRSFFSLESQDNIQIEYI